MHLDHMIIIARLEPGREKDENIKKKEWIKLSKKQNGSNHITSFKKL